ncbi:HU family DNA-binding protein [Acidithiobacillus ferrooxidans]|uniref:HU family DNA-binding protein n=1 Tax=Acidithiobacillus ferrooxidans TaxID=920 RepID=UPI0013D16BCC|nr:HU family DNA-binding protein [Acidithiobacillus ferrooxidans]MBU2859344.1 HU family DNA-binding protein [Acidithiobacillus ferrooxidans]MCR2831036.1 HU family DNA-binding protein [Acidithiobacillus ferrooxidans]
MNKTGFVAALAQHGAMSKVDAEKVFQVFRHTLETELATAGKIVFPGFCTFEVVEKAARKGRNPATGQEIDIPAKKSIKCKAGKEFTDKVNS